MITLLAVQAERDRGNESIVGGCSSVGRNFGGSGRNLARVLLSVVHIACLIRAAEVRIRPEDGSGETPEEGISPFSGSLFLMEPASSEKDPKFERPAWPFNW